MFRIGEKVPIYTDGEDICGSASIMVKPGKRVDHLGIKVEIVGRIESVNDKSSSYDFFAISKDLEPAGVLTESKDYKWKFKLSRILIFTLGKIPRGKAKAP